MTRSCHDERGASALLSSFSLQEAVRAQPRKQMSWALVNLFRVVFARMLGVNLPLLENHSFRCGDPDHVYRFTEIP